MTEADLKGIKVSAVDWIEKLKEWNVRGYKKIKEKYIIDTSRIGLNGQPVYILELKENVE